MKKIIVLFMFFLSGCSQTIVDDFIAYPHDFSNVEMTYQYRYEGLREDHGISVQLFYDEKNAVITSSFDGESSYDEILYFIEDKQGIIMYFHKIENDIETWGMENVSQIGLSIAETLVLDQKNLKYIGTEEVNDVELHVIEVKSLSEIYEGVSDTVNFYYYVNDFGRLEYIIVMQENNEYSLYTEYAFKRYGEVEEVVVSPVFIENVLKNRK